MDNFLFDPNDKEAGLICTDKEGEAVVIYFKTKEGYFKAIAGRSIIKINILDIPCQK